ncbi:ABC transporter substrate-binding protein [Desulfosarcina ovata subsp. sediminis]|uniref:ABC transporter substrate-binding protein n=1 Tax=Desulfosarcina ovata subsp. sediminis TaxID=885957 RepID=A0A5K7ZN81_9BACT|nr:hypothetical protein [Desulfosarcina ovata]BBO81059.1 ABC transporter substrate-binding protein [Desulfosarcina ovata subsp. sediminis]
MEQRVLARNRLSGALTVLAFFLFQVLSTQAIAQDVAIIVNKDLPVDTVSAADIQSIFLGKKTAWSSGEKVVFAVLKDDDARNAFLKLYVKKSPSQYDNYWKKMVFTGKGQMPHSFTTKEEIMAFVNGTPGAVSYVPAPADASVKMITVQ